MRGFSDLERRRRELLARAETQREEIAWRIGQLGPRRWTHALASGAASGALGALRSQRQHPLAWIVAVAALLLLRRPRDALFLLARARGALKFAAGATQVLGLVAALRRKKR